MAEHEVALTPSGVATTLYTAYIADMSPRTHEILENRLSPNELSF